jgi:hypothetical protein
MLKRLGLSWIIGLFLAFTAMAADTSTLSENMFKEPVPTTKATGVFDIKGTNRQIQYYAANTEAFPNLFFHRPLWAFELDRKEGRGLPPAVLSTRQDDGLYIAKFKIWLSMQQLRDYIQEDIVQRGYKGSPKHLDIRPWPIYSAMVIARNRATADLLAKKDLGNLFQISGAHEFFLTFDDEAKYKKFIALLYDNLVEFSFRYYFTGELETTTAEYSYEIDIVSDQIFSTILDANQRERKAPIFQDIANKASTQLQVNVTQTIVNDPGIVSATSPTVEQLLPVLFEMEREVVLDTVSQDELFNSYLQPIRAHLEEVSGKDDTELMKKVQERGTETTIEGGGDAKASVSVNLGVLKFGGDGEADAKATRRITKKDLDESEKKYGLTFQKKENTEFYQPYSIKSYRCKVIDRNASINFSTIRKKRVEAGGVEDAPITPVEFNTDRLAEALEHVRKKYIAWAAPTGTIVAYYGGSIPDGWLLCDGKEIPTDSIYNALRLMMKDNRVPDLRGYFLRGADSRSAEDKNGIDPERPRAVGTIQLDEFKEHIHDGPGKHVHHWKGYWTRGSHGNDRQVRSRHQLAEDPIDPITLEDGAHNHGPKGGAETRPKNISVNFIIKY